MDDNDTATQKNIAVINSVINTPLILISIIGNSLVLAAILKTPSIRTPSMIMISSLAVSDLLVGVMAQPLFIANKFKSLTEKDLFLQHVTVMTGFFSLRSLSWYDYSDLRGPVHGLSLPHAIFHNRDQISRAVHRNNDLVVHFLMPGALLLESSFVSFAGRNLPCYMSHYLHISLHKNVRNRSTSRLTDSRSEARSRNLKLCK